MKLLLVAPGTDRVQEMRLAPLTERGGFVEWVCAAGADISFVVLDLIRDKASFCDVEKKKEALARIKSGQT